MRLPRLLALPFLLALPIAVSCGGHDDDAAAPTAPAADSVAPDGGPADAGTACDADAPAAAVSAAFTTLYCTQIADVADLYEVLALPVASTTQLELLRLSVCAPDAEIPDRAASERSFELFVRGSTQQNPALGDQWLDAGVLEAFERTENEDGTLVVDLEFDDGSIERLADAEQGVFDAVVTDPAAYCAS